MSKLTAAIESVKAEVFIMETVIELQGHLIDPNSITETAQLDEMYHTLDVLKSRLSILIPEPRQESRRYTHTDTDTDTNIESIKPKPKPEYPGPAHLMTAREYQHAVYLAKSDKILPTVPDCMTGYGFDDFRPCGVIIREVAALIRYQCQYLISWSEDQIQQVKKQAMKKFIITPALEEFADEVPEPKPEPKPEGVS